MGSLRRGLALAAWLPSTAFAEVCDKERPNWDGTPLTVFSELVHFVSTPAFYVLFTRATTCAFLRNRWLALPCLLWCGLLLANWFVPTPPGFDDIRNAAIRAECIGPQTLPISLTIAICALAIWRLFCRNKRQEI